MQIKRQSENVKYHLLTNMYKRIGAGDSFSPEYGNPRGVRHTRDTVVATINSKNIITLRGGIIT